MRQSLLRLTTWILIVGLLAQFYAAGLGIIAGFGMRIHAALGWLLVLAGFIRLGLALAGGAREPRRLWAAIIALLLFLQPVLIFGARARWPAIAALHAVDGAIALVLLIVISVEFRSERLTARAA